MNEVGLIQHFTMSEIFDGFFFEELLLVCHAFRTNGFDEFPVGPAVGIYTKKRVVPVVAQQAADGDVHQVLFFFFGEFGAHLPQLLYADEQQNSVEFRRRVEPHRIFYQMAYAQPLKIKFPILHLAQRYYFFTKNRQLFEQYLQHKKSIGADSTLELHENVNFTIYDAAKKPLTYRKRFFCSDSKIKFRKSIFSNSFVNQLLKQLQVNNKIKS